MGRHVEYKTKLVAALIHLELLMRGAMRLTEILQRVGFRAARGEVDMLAARPVHHVVGYSEQAPLDDLIDCRRKIEALAIDLMRKDNASLGSVHAYRAEACEKFRDEVRRGKPIEGPWRVRENDIRSSLRLLKHDGRVLVTGCGAQARWRASSSKKTRSQNAAYELLLRLLDAKTP